MRRNFAACPHVATWGAQPTVMLRCLGGALVTLSSLCARLLVSGNEDVRDAEAPQVFMPDITVPGRSRSIRPAVGDTRVRVFNPGSQRTPDSAVTVDRRI